MILYVLIGVIGFSILLYIFFLLRSTFGPKKIKQIARLIDINNTRLAIKHLKVLLSKNERNIVAHWYLAEAYIKQKKYELSLVEYKYILKLNKFNETVTELGVRKKLVKVYEKFKQTEEVLKEYILLTQLEPSNDYNFFKIGEIFFNKNQTDKATKYFVAAYKLNPMNPENLFYLGRLYLRKNQIKEALNSFSKVLDIRSDLYGANFYLGIIQKNLKMYDKARINFETAERDPSYKLRALLEKGKLLLELDNVREAVIQLERAIKFIKMEDDVSAAVRYALADCYERTKELPKAIDQWEIINQYKPGYEEVVEKLQMYSDLRTDDRLKDFLTASKQIFIEICKKIIVAMELEVLEVMPVDDDTVEFLVTEQEGKWRDTKKNKRIILFKRDATIVTEKPVREIQDKMKSHSATRGLVLAVAGFSPSAMEYSLTRPIDLMDKKQLTDLLKKVKY